ncbi:helix-turn-helix domain-containing protein [Sphingomonas sp. CD22]|uniref:helix-turn-helix domain-containing protein n=1 Tax=Sphingomonas sp. CD22 TaxID=3100214 RepID=UPI002AE078F7|nr:helix-turn-helix domain-containing protein [Sphingomonas sp. CD22]MEA1086460.1 helix-turn-helix domain-containing protein [Sphingomonas sp. CD22]
MLDRGLPRQETYQRFQSTAERAVVEGGSLAIDGAVLTSIFRRFLPRHESVMGFADHPLARTAHSMAARSHYFPAADVPAEIGGSIRQLRQAKGWSQAALARQSGVSRETILRVEAGKRKPLAATVLMVIAVLLADQDDVELQDVVPAWPEFDPCDPVGHGPRSRARRLQLKRTLADVATMTGVSEATLSRFERGIGGISSLIEIEITGLGDHMPRLRSESLAHALRFHDLADHEAFCDADDWRQWPI